MLESYVRSNLRGFEIKRIAGDGLCIVHVFQESLTYKNIVLTTQDICCSLNPEITKKLEFYKTFVNYSVNVALELENFLREPLSYYNSETGDLFIFSLGNYYNFNVVIYHADTTKCWVTNFHRGLSDKNLHFARSISEHIDPIVPQKKRSLPSTSLLYKSVAAKTRKKESYDLLFDASSLDEEYVPVPYEYVPTILKEERSGLPGTMSSETYDWLGPIILDHDSDVEVTSLNNAIINATEFVINRMSESDARSNDYVESGPTLYQINETQLSDVISLSETNSDDGMVNDDRLVCVLLFTSLNYLHPFLGKALYIQCYLLVC